MVKALTCTLFIFLVLVAVLGCPSSRVDDSAPVAGDAATPSQGEEASAADGLPYRIIISSMELRVASDALPAAGQSEALLRGLLEGSERFGVLPLPVDPERAAQAPGEDASEPAGASASWREDSEEHTSAAESRREDAGERAHAAAGQQDVQGPASTELGVGAERTSGRPGDSMERGATPPLPRALRARLRGLVDVQRTGPDRWEAEVLLEVTPERRAELPAALDALGRARVDSSAARPGEAALEGAMRMAFSLLEARAGVLLGTPADVLAATRDERAAVRISAWEEAAERRLEGSEDAARRWLEGVEAPLSEEELREMLAVAGLAARLEARELAPLLIDRVPTLHSTWVIAFLPALQRLGGSDVRSFLEVLAEGHESELVRAQALHWLQEMAAGRGGGR